MPPVNKVWTLRDIFDYGERPAKQEGSNANSSRYESIQGMLATAASVALSSGDMVKNTHHIPSLPDAKQAKDLLHRVVREFEPIAIQQGYNVFSISKLCCCDDGLDFCL
jgi:hypothetical protein